METKKRLHLSKTQSFCLFLYRYSFHFKTRNPRIFHSFHDDFFFQFYPLIRIINLSQFTLVTIISFFFHYIFCLISKTYCHLPKRRRTSTGNLISTKYNMKTMNSHHIVFHFIVKFYHFSSILIPINVNDWFNQISWFFIHYAECIFNLFETFKFVV